LTCGRYSNFRWFPADHFHCKIQIDGSPKAAYSGSIEAPWPRLKIESTINWEACSTNYL